MDRIKGAGHVGNLFVAEDVATSRPPTEITPEWMNAVQEEICTFIEGQGFVLDPADNTQLTKAIRKAIQSGQHSIVFDNAIFAPAVAGTGKAVYWDSAANRFDLAVADGTVKQNVVGFADVADAKVYAFGWATLFAGLTPGRYYLDGATAGAITTVAPTNMVFVGIAKSVSDVFIDIDAGGLTQAQADARYAQPGATQNWTHGQSGSVPALPATTGTLAFNFTDASNFSGQVTGAVIFGNGYTGPGAGKATWFCIRVQQNGATLYNWAFGTNWKYTGGSAAIPAQTQTLGAWDEIIGQVLGDGTISFYVRSDVR